MTRQSHHRQARPARPGAPARITATFGALLLLLAGCSTPDPARTIQPAPPITPPTQRSSADTAPVTPTPAILDPVNGERERQATWRLVAAPGTDLIVEVQAGGAPCDAVTGADVTENPQTVSLTIWAGATPGANCAGQPALLGTFWIRVPLDAPLGDRTLGPR